MAAFLLVYLIWGSTYLAIHLAIQTLPPFLMAGTRFLIAGALLWAWECRDGWPAVRAAAIIGTLMLMGGNGGVVWAQQRIPSGLAALIVATVPLWMVLLEWRQGRRPSGQVAAGLLLASFSWACGSLYSRHAPLPSSLLLATAMEMLAGGTALLGAAFLVGEYPRFAWAHASAVSLWAVAYLVVFGAIIGFSAYIWLLRMVSVASVSTYAFVNPVVALVLGWLFLAEPVTARTLAASAVIVAGVALIILAKAPRRA